MIIGKDVLAFIPVAQEFADRGITLEAKPGPLSVLANELQLAMGYAKGLNYEDSNSVAGLASEIEIISDSLNKHKESGENLRDVSSHDKRIDDLATLIATGVQATVTKAKLVVIPMVQKIEDAINNALVDYEDRSVFNIGINEIGIHEVLDCDSVYEYFEQYKGRKPDNLASFKVFPELDSVGICKLIETGSPELNEYMTKVIQKSLDGVEAGKWIYDCFFNEKCANGRAVVDYNVIKIRSTVKACWSASAVVEAFMVAYYVCRGLIEKTPDGTNTSLAQLESSLNNLAKSFGALIFGELDYYRKNQNMKLLLPYGLPAVDKKNGAVGINNDIYVDREVYAEFLSNGGSPEVIMGSMVSDQVVNMQSLLDRAEIYKAKYDNFVQLNHQYTVTSKLSIQSTAIRREFIRSLKEDPDVPENAINDGAVLRLDKYLKRFGGDEVSCPEKLYVFLRGAVSNSLYPDDPLVEALISDIDSFEDNNNQTMSEYSAIAIGRRIVDWLSDGIITKK